MCYLYRQLRVILEQEKVIVKESKIARSMFKQQRERDC